MNRKHCLCLRHYFRVNNTTFERNLSLSKKSVRIWNVFRQDCKLHAVAQTLYKWNGHTLFKREYPDGVLFFWWQKCEIKLWLMGFFQTISSKYVNTKICHKDVYFLLIGTGYISRPKWFKLTAWVVQTCDLYVNVCIGLLWHANRADVNSNGGHKVVGIYNTSRDRSLLMIYDYYRVIKLPAYFITSVQAEIHRCNKYFSKLFAFFNQISHGKAWLP